MARGRKPPAWLDGVKAMKPGDVLPLRIEEGYSWQGVNKLVRKHLPDADITIKRIVDGFEYELVMKDQPAADQ